MDKVKENLVLKKLRKDEVVSVVGIGAFPYASLVEMVGKIGFDCIWFDMEHRPFGLPELCQMTLACRATGMEAMVRIVKGNYTSVMKPLETGATGLMLPHCMSAKQNFLFGRNLRKSAS
jgi:2-keto-3-deoxy-L-rhamnonate aldolase RhmA